MIRKAIDHEIDSLLNITKACASKMITEGIYQWNEHYPSKDAFVKNYKRGELYVLLNEHHIIGCITISELKDEEYNQVSWLTLDKNNYYIHRLAVHPDFQGFGNAKKLMDFAEGFAKKQKASSVRLDTFSQNKRNNTFYKNRGYKKLEDIYFPKQSEHPFHCYELVLQ